MPRVIIIAVVLSILASATNAGPFFNRRAKRYAPAVETNSHNVTNNAPAAPINIAMTPQQNCPTGDCIPQQYTQQALPQQYYQPTIPQLSPQVIQGVPQILQSRVAESSTSDERIERILRLISNLESRLPVRAESEAIQGDSVALLSKLPKVQIVVRNQGDEVVDVMELDTKQWLLEQLNK